MDKVDLKNETPPLVAIHTPEREGDLQKLCAAVLNTGLSFHYNPNGADWGNCPFCWARYHNELFDISDIEHKADCAYFIAKDLSANIHNIKPPTNDTAT